MHTVRVPHLPEQGPVSVRPATTHVQPSPLQPLLKREQAGGLSYAAFALPAVQAVIGAWQERGAAHLCCISAQRCDGAAAQEQPGASLRVAALAHTRPTHLRFID